MKFRDFLYQVILLVLSIVLPPILSTYWSYLQTGDYFYWFSNYPLREISLGLTVLCFILALTFIRLKMINQNRFGVHTASRYGYEEIGSSIEYEGLKWRIIAPRAGPYDRSDLDTSPNRLRIRMPPRCPKCETEIEQSQSFWGGYVWKCVACGFKKKSRDSFNTVKERVEKIAQRLAEKEMEKNENQNNE